MVDRRVKFGVLFSNSGPMAVSERAHLQGILLACDEINASGGQNGVLLEPIILDPKGDDRKYAEYAAELLLRHRVTVIFGCCLSSSRRAVVPVVERYNGILFYPSVYEGFEYSTNVIYGGAVPNQIVPPLLDYLFSHHGHRAVLIGSETYYAREINRILGEFMDEGGGEIVAERYLPLGCSSEKIRSTLESIDFREADFLLSTVVGNDSITLYNHCAALRRAEQRVQIVSLTTTESELQEMRPEARAGHLSISPYFGTLDTPASRRFVSAFRSRYGEQVTPGVYSEVCYSMIHLFANAISEVDTDETDDLLSSLAGSVFKGPAGDLFVDMETNHMTLRALVGRSTACGRFDLLYRAPQIIRADPYLVAYDRSVPNTVPR